MNIFLYFCSILICLSCLGCLKKGTDSEPAEEEIVDMLQADMMQAGMEINGGLMQAGMELTGGSMEGGVEINGGTMEAGIEVSAGVMEGGIEVNAGMMEAGVEVNAGMMAGGNEMEGGMEITGGMIQAGTEPETMSCEANASTACYDNSVYWVNSCGDLGSIKERCEGNLSCVDDVSPVCVCDQCCGNQELDEDELCDGEWFCNTNCEITNDCVAYLSNCGRYENIILNLMQCNANINGGSTINRVTVTQLVAFRVA